MHLILLEAISKPVHHCQLIGRRKVSLDHTSAACCLHRGGIVLFVIVTGGIPPVSVASHIQVTTTTVTIVLTLQKFNIIAQHILILRFLFYKNEKLYLNNKLNTNRTLSRK